MEKVTLTKLYDTLAQKMGRHEAECLTNYVELKVKDELNTKTDILATKVSVKEEIHGLRNELKKDIYDLRSEMKEDIHALRNEVTAGIHTLRNEMKEHSLSQQKWMLSIFITVVIMIMGLYATIFLNTN
jgi:dynactin complex subunit